MTKKATQFAAALAFEIEQNEWRHSDDAMATNSYMRLKMDLAALRRRSNLHLTLGVLIAVSGLVMLGMRVLSDTSTANDLEEFASHFVPRLTLVVVVELFAYFFLRLYRENLGEIRYYQNELTNIESKHMALRLALRHGNPKIVSDILMKLADTDRNHILRKGETTIELEKARMHRDEQRDLIKHLSAAFLSKKD